MKTILRIFSWKTTIIISIILLVFLSVFSFYGPYTNQFYFLKLENYIFPLLSLFHFVYLYAVWFKITENEYPDLPMRNLEYALYVIFFIYIFKAIETVFVLLSFEAYENFILPAMFIPICGLIISMYVLLLFITILTFFHRKITVGKYDFANFNENIDSWN